MMRAHTAMQPANATSLYFGKIPTRGDFVKSASGTKVIALIDNWVALGIELLAANPCWKSYYDSAEPIDFLFIAPHRRHAICGALIASSDASARRFPFIAATLFEIDGALSFLPISPLLLERHANHQRALAQHAARVHDATEALNTLDGMPLKAETRADGVVDSYRHFLRNTTITGLGNALALDAEQATVRQMVLAVGFLLQPVLTNYTRAPQKGLAIPLPDDPARRAFVKSLWLNLISVFLSRAEFELGIFSGPHYGAQKLIVTFNGAAPNAFHALFDEQAAGDYLIDIAQSSWADDLAGQDPVAYKLSGYLEHGDLPLQHLVDTFCEAFLG